MLSLKNGSTAITDESRILAEGQKDGERNLPDMASYAPAQFEQALIANGEQAVQRVYKQAAAKIAKLQPVFQAHQKRLGDIERRLKPVFDGYKARAKELGRDVTIPFPPMLHIILIAFLGLGEFPLNTVVFRLFGEAEYLTYVMASTLAITIPLIGVFIGVQMRHSLPRFAGNLLIGVGTPLAVGAALFAVSVLRNTYIFSQFSGGAPVVPEQTKLAWALFALNSLVFFAATAASYFAHDPDEKLDQFYRTYASLDRKRNSIRGKLFRIGTQLNGETKGAKSEIEQIRALTNERVALYRQTNLRFRRLMAPASFRRNPEFPRLDWWPEVVLNSDDEDS